MGFIGSMLGVGGTGANWKAQGANVQNPVSTQAAQDQMAQAQQALQQQQAFVNALNAQGGLGKMGDVYSQYQNIAAGQGPNPAQMALQNATGQNVANQAALMASARGTSANPGMIARQAAQQGAGIQQQAAGQAALMQAQQQLAGLQGASGLASQLGGMQQSGIQNMTGAQQNQQNALLNAIAQQNQANIQNVSQQNQANAGMQQQIAQKQGGLLGGALSGLGSAALGALFPPAAAVLPAITSGLPGLQGGMPLSAGSFAQGGVIPAIGKENYANTPKSKVGRHFHRMASGGEISVGTALMQGGHVPGQASVAGDSLRNDKVHALLSPGEVVLPRSITQSGNAPKKAAAFVAKVLSHKGLKK